MSHFTVDRCNFRLLMIMRGFGRRQGEPGYTRLGDINLDGVIDVSDFQLWRDHCVGQGVAAMPGAGARSHTMDIGNGITLTVNWE